MPYTITPITAKEAGQMLGLSPKTLYNGGAGTGHFTRLRYLGTRTVRFVRQEVEKHLERARKNDTTRS